MVWRQRVEQGLWVVGMLTAGVVGGWWLMREVVHVIRAWYVAWMPPEGWSRAWYEVTVGLPYIYAVTAACIVAGMGTLQMTWGLLGLVWEWRGWTLLPREDL